MQRLANSSLSEREYRLRERFFLNRFAAEGNSQSYPDQDRHEDAS